MLRNSPTALRVLKSALNAAEDGQAGIQQLGGDATLLFYQSEEGNEVGPSRLVACVFVCLFVCVWGWGWGGVGVGGTSSVSPSRVGALQHLSSHAPPWAHLHAALQLQHHSRVQLHRDDLRASGKPGIWRTPE